MQFKTNITVQINLTNLNSLVKKLDDKCEKYYYSYKYTICKKNNEDHITITFIPSSSSGLYNNQYDDMIYEIFS